MAISANIWLRMRYADATCGGTGLVSAGVTTDRCPDCKGTGLDENRIAQDTQRDLIPKWVLEQRG